MRGSTKRDPLIPVKNLEIQPRMPIDLPHPEVPELAGAHVSSAIGTSCAALSSIIELDVTQPLQGTTTEQRLDDLARRLRQGLDLFALGWFAVDGARRLTGDAAFSHHLPHAEEGLERVLTEAAEQACAGDSAFTLSVRPSRPFAVDSSADDLLTIVACPASSSQVAGSQTASPFVLAGAFRESSPPETLISALQAAADVWSANLAEVGQDPDQGQELAVAAAIIDLAVRVEACESLDTALHRLVTDAAQHTGCRLVAVGLKNSHGQLCARFAVSDTALVPLDSAAYRALKAALDDIVLRGEATQWPATTGQRRGLLTHRQLLQALSLDAVVGAPLQTADQSICGAWLFVGDQTVVSEPGYRRFAEAAAYRLGSSLHLIRRLERPAWRTLFSRVWDFISAAPKISVLAAVMALSGLLCVPVPFRVSADCELQPAVRRFVAAPFEGTLEKSFVEPGETVEAGQLLARMDAREIQWELAGLDAEQSRTLKERDVHLAKQDIAAAEISRYDLERLLNRRELLIHRQEHLEIRSPLRGIVITGDLKRSEGVPLKVGDRLFEISPLRRMLVEVAIPEPEIRHVAETQRVTISLDAFPGETLDGSVKRIHPRSEIRDEQHVFIAEIEFDTSHDRLRPGMKGTSRIAAGSRSIGWIGFHKPWEEFLMWMGW